MKKRKVKRLPMRSLTCWGIIAVKATNKNHEDSPEDGNNLQRLARGATVLFARISCFSTGTTPLLPSSMQHGGHASCGGRSPNNRSSAEVQA
ncbi:hypothetical protein MTR_6g464100 [Medicago truncatula]|uniref:Uncharacterized protein n=1 Tax=Medicago truncatula TaxID=3880 RepID=A0A072U9R2_MEDTR|nr:hypothetical protein MTR_6g464100 [Medicago truncatula]